MSPAPLLRIAESTARHPAASAAMGFLVAVVGISLLVTMTFNILLIPVALLGLLVKDRLAELPQIQTFNKDQIMNGLRCGSNSARI